MSHATEGTRKPVTIWNPTPREERALKDDRVIERMKETGASAHIVVLAQNSELTRNAIEREKPTN